MAKLPSLFRSKRIRSAVPAIVVTLLATAWPVFLENWSDLKELSSRTIHCDRQQADAPASFQFLSAYESIFQWTGMRPATDQVRLLSLGAGLPEVQNNPCLGRAFTADLLNTLGQRHPRAVALDKFYQPHSCDSFPEGTGALRASVARFPAPLVIGVSSEATQVEGDDPYACSCEEPSLDLTGPQVHHGYVDLNEEVLQVPLRWVIRRSGAPPKAYLPANQSYGLAYATALEAKPELARRLAPLTEDASESEHPYANLWGEPIASQEASTFLCGAATPEVRARWRLDCKTGVPALDVAGKVVVIGSDDVSDAKLVMGENLPGYVVQGRYLAALLGGAYLRAWPLLLRLFIAISLVGATEWAVLQHEIDGSLPPLWGSKLPVMVGVTGICALMLLAGAASLALGYLPPLDLMATAVLIFLGDLRLWMAEWWRAKPQTKLRREVLHES